MVGFLRTISAFAVLLLLCASAEAETLTRYPTSIIGGGSDYTATPGGALYAAIDEAVEDDTDYISATLVGTPAVVQFGFPAPNLPSGATIVSVKVFARAKLSGGACEMLNGLVVGGASYYDGGSFMDSTISTYSATWSINPKTGSAWTLADVNGTGTNPLQGFALVKASDVAATGYYYQSNIVITFTRNDCLFFLGGD